jgi:hypothetical protein
MRPDRLLRHTSLAEEASPPNPREARNADHSRRQSQGTISGMPKAPFRTADGLPTPLASSYFLASVQREQRFPEPDIIKRN